MQLINKKFDDTNKEYLHVERLYLCYVGHLNINSKEENVPYYNGYNWKLKNDKINFSYENVLIFYLELQSKIIE